MHKSGSSFLVPLKMVLGKQWRLKIYLDLIFIDQNKKNAIYKKNSNSVPVDKRYSYYIPEESRHITRVLSLQLGYTVVFVASLTLKIYKMIFFRKVPS